MTSQSARWYDYVLESGDGVRRLWSEHFAERKRAILFVLAKGFDPRMCLALKQLVECSAGAHIDVKLIEYDEGPDSPSHVHADKVELNMRELVSCVDSRGSLLPHALPIWSPDGRRIASRSASQVFTSSENIEGYTDVFLDVSAMPRGVYLPLAAKILHLLDQAKLRSRETTMPNFHLLVWEDAVLDRCIQQQGIEDDAAFLHPFSGGLDREATADQPRVWLPLLGTDRLAQLEHIHELVTPDEICPILPSPAKTARLGDEIVLEYRELLFERLRVDPRNFIYVSECNPFEAYRQIRGAICRYRDSLDALGGCKFVLSALSSKLLSISVLLVAYDLRTRGGSADREPPIDVGIAHVEAKGYRLCDEDNGAEGHPSGELFDLWLSGECYET